MIAQPDNYDARANIMWARTVAHNDIIGVGDGKTWGFVRLSSDDITEIYNIAARAKI